MNRPKNKPSRSLDRARNRDGISGFSLIEVLVTIVILLVGLLGLAGLQGRAFTAQLESYQRSQALVLLKDMADRLDANRKDAASYINNNPLGVSSVSPTGASVAAQDLREWRSALLGSAEGGNAGAMIGARGCIYQVTAPASGVAATYRVVVAWQGLNSTVAPDVSTTTSPGKCGENLYKDRTGAVKETLHRVIAIPVSVADLN